MPFLRAGFRANNRVTGIRAFISHPRYVRAELRVFECGDYFWYGKQFIAWGDAIMFRDLIHVRGCWGLKQSEWPRANKKARDLRAF